MTLVFKELAKFGYAGNQERKRMLNSMRFKKTVLDQIPNDEYHKKQKELLKSEGIEETTLLQEAVYDTIVEGGKPFKCFREILPIAKKDGYQIRVTYSSGSSYAKEIPEGAPFEVETSKLKKQDINIKKYGVRPLITNELIEDGLWDIVEWELKNAGQALENRFNRECLTTILKGSLPETDAAGSGLSVTYVAQGINTVKKNGFIPDTLVMHPTAEMKMLSDTNIIYANYWGSAGPLQEYKVPKIGGLKPYVCSVTAGGDDAYTTAAASTPMWIDADAAYKYDALIFDSSKLAMVGMRRDYTVEKYEDPIHDMVGINASMRFGVAVIHEGAGTKVLY